MPSRVPWIVHLDADAFFVSVELALQPQYRGKKVAVGGRERGIIASASYEARAAGVYTPMPTARALRVCPDLILLPHKGSYGAVSRQMFDLCEQLTPLVQRNSIDEGYLDLSPCGLRTTEAVVAAVRGLQARIWDALEIPVSMGIAGNKLVAQIASKLRKPRGFEVVAPGDEAAFLAPLGVGKLPGVGPKTEAALEARGIRLIGDVLKRSERELESLVGSGWRGLVAAARGEDDGVVETAREDAKSYSQQETFAKDTGDFAALERTVKGMVDELMRKVRADGKRVRTVTVKVRYPDFGHDSAGRSLPEASDLEAPFYPLVSTLLRQAWKRPGPVRLVGVRFSGVDDGPRQLDLFGGPGGGGEGAGVVDEEKRRKLAAVLDRLNAGKDVRVRHGHQL